MRCKKCGREVAAGEKFCKYCGESVQNSSGHSPIVQGKIQNNNGYGNHPKTPVNNNYGGYNSGSGYGAGYDNGYGNYNGGGYDSYNGGGDNYDGGGYDGYDNGENYDNYYTEKKSGAGKIITIVVAIVLVLGIAGFCVWYFVIRDDSDEEETTEADSAISEEITTSSKNASSVSAKYKDIASVEEIKFTVSDTSATFMDANTDLFPCSAQNASKLQTTEKTAAFSSIKTNTAAYNATIIKAESLYVASIEKVTAKNYTFLQLNDNGSNSYICYYLGDIVDVKVGDTVTAHMLPLDMADASGLSDKAAVCALCLYEKTAATTAAATTALTNEQQIEQQLKNDPVGFFEDQPDDWYYVTTKKDPLRIRASGDENAQILDTVEKGEAVYVYGMYNGWAYVETTDGKFGWASAQYLTLASDVNP